MKIQEQYSVLADIYDKIYGKKMYHNYAQFVLRNLDDYGIQDADVLDVGCGTGSLIALLQKKVKSCEGVDSSRNMIKIAKAKNPHVAFKCADMTSFSMKRRFDVALCTFDAINYVETLLLLRKTFTNIKKHLKKGGLFIADFNTSLKQIPQSFSYKDVVFENERTKKGWTAIVHIATKDGESTERHEERFYSQKEMLAALKYSGFNEIKWFADFNTETVDEESRPRLIFVANA